jgi:hypothetical protein
MEDTNMYFEELEFELDLKNVDRPPYNYDSLAVLVSGEVMPGDGVVNMPETLVSDLTIFAIFKSEEIEIDFEGLDEDHQEIVLTEAHKALSDAYEETALDFYDDDSGREDLL